MVVVVVVEEGGGGGGGGGCDGGDGGGDSGGCRGGRDCRRNRSRRNKSCGTTATRNGSAPFGSSSSKEAFVPLSTLTGLEQHGLLPDSRRAEEKKKSQEVNRPQRGEPSRGHNTVPSERAQGSAATPNTPLTAGPGDTTASHLPDRARGGGHHHSRTARDGKEGEADHDPGGGGNVQAAALPAGSGTRWWSPMHTT